MRIEQKGGQFVLSGQDISYFFNTESGELTKSLARGKEYPLRGIMVDVGVEGAYARGSMAFDPLDNKRTWETPLIAPQHVDTAVFEGLTVDDGYLVAAYACGNIRIWQKYDLCNGALRVTAVVQSLYEEKVTVNGTAFLTAMPLQNTHFDFPTNAPADLFDAAQLKDDAPITAGLVGSMAHMESDAGHLNVLFLDLIEKWSQGVYRFGDTVVAAYIASVECWLQRGETFTCGHLFIQPVPQGDPYIAIRDHFTALGYYAATDGLREGVLYSGHPHGTMDNHFSGTKDLYQYAEELPAIKALGVDHLWILPVFEHLDRGVYHPTDQAIIDECYGGEAAMKYFADKAHEIGLTVLFDYVPHGPAPMDPLSIEKKQWCSLRRDLTQQEEWDCVSFDMTNPEYLRYTSDMVGSHVRRFDIDGARIDCAMGGLSNWAPYGDHRPSMSNLAGGVAISGAIKRGFQEMGKKAFNMPENFNPVPAYYPVTDVFYGMNLYRALVELDKRREDAKYFVENLTRFLSIERRAMPVEMKKLRFLGNHDTVSWVWQCARAYEVYGYPRAQALFALMAFIDGVPFIYQGDEEPELAGKTGLNQREFFANLYAARKAHIGEGTEIEYLNTGCGVMAFIRLVEGVKKLVLISLSEKDETVSLPELQGKISLLGNLAASGDTVTVPSYQFDIFA